MKFINFAILIIILSMNCNTEKSKKFPYQFVKYNLNTKIIPTENMAKIDAMVQFKAMSPQNEISFLLNRVVRVNRIYLDNKEIDYQIQQNFDLTKYLDKIDSTIQKDYETAAEITLFLKDPKTEGEIKLNYDLFAKDSVNKASFSREYIAYQIKGYIGDKGLFFSPSYFWYPYLPANLAQFSITCTTPKDISVITQGHKIFEQTDIDSREVKWEINYPADAVHLVGANFEIRKEKYNSIEIYTYFFPESQDLAPAYLKACKRYLEMYEKLIGSYPFSKFAVVENFFPTGYGMPSYTLLGSQVIRLPFIIYTSLGHEITHNWWGNSVYVDYESGNWCEGLTTYFADYHYKEMKNAKDAMEYRRDIDRDFSVYVTEKYDRPLSEFKERTESASRALGYGKSAMVFHQLRRIIGDSLFTESFKQFYRKFKFKKASWQDIQETVEQVSGKDYQWFFMQWIQRKGAPKLSLTDVNIDDQKLNFTLHQSDEIFRLYVPIVLEYNDSSHTLYNVWLEKNSQQYSLPLEKKPMNLAVDPNFDVFRKLDQKEIPPTLSEIFAKENTILVLPNKCMAKKLKSYESFAKAFVEGETNISIKSYKELSEEELESSSIYILGNPQENSLWDMLNYSPIKELKIKNKSIELMDKTLPAPEDLLVLTARALDNKARNFCFIVLGDKGKIGRVGHLLSHYGKYSYLLFTSGKNSLKGVYEITESPLIYHFQ